MKRSTFFLLILLLGICYAAFRLLTPEPDPAFETQLIVLDTASISMLSVLPLEVPDDEILLKREDKTWIASQGSHSVKAPYAAVNKLLAGLTHIESHYVVGKGPEEWSAGGLDPGEGIRIRVFEDDKTLEDFVIGNYQAEMEGSGITYLRLWDDEAVYAVQGALDSIFWPGFEAFRSKDFLQIDPLKVREIRWEPAEMDTAVIFRRGDSLWGQNSQVDTFLEEIKYLQGKSFVDAFDPTSDEQMLEGRITFFGTDWDAPLEVSYYRDSTRAAPFIFYSTSNPDNFFESDSNGLFLELVQPFYSSFSVDSIQ